MTWAQLDAWMVDDVLLREGRTLDPSELPSVSW
jgi:hypothetical protein